MLNKNHLKPRIAYVVRGFFILFSMETANKNSWKTIPMDIPHKITISLYLSEKQYLHLIKGFIPKDMDEKWFIYFENGVIHLHRSWTGYEIFNAPIYKVEESYFIPYFIVEKNTKKYNISTDKEALNSFKTLVEMYSEV